MGKLEMYNSVVWNFVHYCPAGPVAYENILNYDTHEL